MRCEAWQSMLPCSCAAQSAVVEVLGMTDTPTILPMTPSDPAKAIEKARAVMARPEYTDFPEAPVRAPPPSHSGLECHMRSMSYCQNEPHCSEAGECVLFLAVDRSKPNIAAPEPPQLLRIPSSFHSVDDVLGAAAQMNLPNCVVISELGDGALVLLDSGMTMAQTNWVLDRLKALMLAPSQPARPR